MGFTERVRLIKWYCRQTRYYIVRVSSTQFFALDTGDYYNPAVLTEYGNFWPTYMIAVREAQKRSSDPDAGLF